MAEEKKHEEEHKEEQKDQEEHKEEHKEEHHEEQEEKHTEDEHCCEDEEKKEGGGKFKFNMNDIDFKLNSEFFEQLDLSALKNIGKEFRAFIRSTMSSGRANVLMVRVEDETVSSIDALVEADLFRSRSEAAAFLIAKGLDATTDIFTKVMEKTAQIENLRSEIRDILGVDDEEGELDSDVKEKLADDKEEEQKDEPEEKKEKPKKTRARKTKKTEESKEEKTEDE